MYYRIGLLSLASGVALLAGCGSAPTDISGTDPQSGASTLAAPIEASAGLVTPNFDPHDFVGTVTNRFFPLKPGTRFVYQGIEDGEEETNTTIVTRDRKQILGISATVVLDRVFVHGELKEKTFDWYAQDNRGNVWYLGEDTKEFEDGKVVSTEGSWEAGKQGAKPGIIMLAHPRTGERYRQEFQAGVAEDQARVTARGVDVTVPYGSFDNCLKTLELTPLEPGVSESKLYCPGVGFVKAHSKEGPFTRLVLTHITQVSR